MTPPCGLLKETFLDLRYKQTADLERNLLMHFSYISQTAFNPLASYGLLPVKMRGALLKGDQPTSELKGVPR